jgi:hypothetical protein
LLRHRLLWLVPTLLAWSDPWPTARAASVMDDAGRCLALALYWEAMCGRLSVGKGCVSVLRG